MLNDKLDITMLLVVVDGDTNEYPVLHSFLVSIIIILSFMKRRNKDNTRTRVVVDQKKKVGKRVVNGGKSLLKRERSL